MSTTREELSEQVYRTAVLFKEATEDPANGKWVESARWADYTNALKDHAQFVVAEFKAAQAKEQTC